MGLRAKDERKSRMAYATNLGYPRMGKRRELKKVLEQYWSGKLSETALLEQAAALRKQHWLLQRDLGLEHIPSNDFSLYDQVLDTIALVGAVPERYQWHDKSVDLATYFAMARGVQQDQAGGIAAMEMTKWFDTNYHYIVPEFSPQQTFRLGLTKPLDEFMEAKALGGQCSLALSHSCCLARRIGKISSH
jgi:5-methyltetrahydropteroyltriglutamate--homocysteine methyltransferase